MANWFPRYNTDTSLALTYIKCKLAGFTCLENLNMCIHENKIRGGSELEQMLGICNMNLISLQHRNNKMYYLFSFFYLLDADNGSDDQMITHVRNALRGEIIQWFETLDQFGVDILVATSHLI